MLAASGEHDKTPTPYREVIARRLSQGDLFGGVA